MVWSGTVAGFGAGILATNVGLGSRYHVDIPRMAADTGIGL